MNRRATGRLLVLSPETYNEKTGLRCSVPSRPGYGDTPSRSCFPAGSAVSGVVLADQVKSLDWRARHARFEGHAARRVVDEVLAKVNVLLE